MKVHSKTTLFLNFALAALIGIAAGMPLGLHADDTEIYLGDSSLSTGVRPNVLFSLDTSGSMSDMDGGSSGLLYAINVLNGAAVYPNWDGARRNSLLLHRQDGKIAAVVRDGGDFLSAVAGAPEGAPQQHHGTDADGGIRDIERRPVPGAVIDIDKIHHAATGSEQPIDQVAGGAAEHQRQRTGEPLFITRNPPQPDDDEYTDTNGQGGEQPALPSPRIAKKAESGPRVVGQKEIEKREHRHRLVDGEPMLRQQLAALIGDGNGERKPQPAQASLISIPLRHPVTPALRPRPWRFAP
jgi:hypothetical protein